MAHNADTLVGCDDSGRVLAVVGQGIYLIRRHRSWSAGARLAIGMFDQDAPKPGRECRLFLQLAQVQPGIKKGFLGGVLGQLHITNARQATGKGHVLEAYDQFSKRVGIAGACSANQPRQTIHDESSSTYRVPAGPAKVTRIRRSRRLCLVEQLTLSFIVSRAFGTFANNGIRPKHTSKLTECHSTEVFTGR